MYLQAYIPNTDDMEDNRSVIINLNVGEKTGNQRLFGEKCQHIRLASCLCDCKGEAPGPRDVCTGLAEAEDRFKLHYQASRKDRQREGSESEGDDVQQLPFDESKLSRRKLQGKKNSRMAISEEVFGSFNKKELFIPKVVPKTQGAKVLILNLIRNSILFHNLDLKDEEVVINAMDERRVQTGETVISEGESGDHLFIVQDGEYRCSKVIDGKDTFLKNYTYGDSFGQLALLYNAPRAATIVCQKPGVLYVLDRQTFSHIVKNAACKKRESHQTVLNKIQIFSELNSHEKEQFIDVLKQEKYEPGQYVIRQGQSGDKFYIVIDGKLIAEKQSGKGEEPKLVYQYKEGDYFGELSLVHDVNRQASIKCLTSVRVAFIQRESFKRILGSLEDILKRNEERYNNFQELIKAD